MPNLKSYLSNEEIIEVGIDEAGAGCFAGPLVTASVIWPREIDEEFDICNYNNRINDSKKLSVNMREKLYDFVIENAIDYSIAWIPQERIDEINIRNARLESFHKALNLLNISPDLILVDGDMFNPWYDNGRYVDFLCIKGGDSEFKSIAAASILAKVTRDRYMINLHEEYPVYEWSSNKGYGTQKHINAIKEHGITNHHRKSFGICKEY